MRKHKSLHSSPPICQKWSKGGIIVFIPTKATHQETENQKQKHPNRGYKKHYKFLEVATTSSEYETYAGKIIEIEFYHTNVLPNS